MPEIEILNILTTYCNRTGTKEKHRAANCCTITATTQGAGCEQHYINTRQEAGKPGRCYTNTSSNSHLKSNSTDKPMVNNNEIKYFLPGPNQINERQARNQKSNYKMNLMMF